MVERHIGLQLDEREFLRHTAGEIIARVQALEKQVKAGFTWTNKCFI